MQRFRYIAIEGPVGVGKSTVARLLAERLRARLVLEPIEDNPFIREFYKDPRRAAFQTQIYFLLSRYRQQLDLAQAELFRRVTVTDYVFAKDRIFAYANLSKDELFLYEKIFTLLSPRMTSPELLVLLQARTDVLIDRLQRRGQAGDRDLPAEYVEKINRAYTEHFYDWSECPILTVNVSDVDFTSSERHIDELIQAIGSMRSGREHYVPLAGAD